MITPKEIIEFIDQRLKGPVVPLDVERDAISMIEEYAVEQHQILATTQPQPSMSAENVIDEVNKSPMPILLKHHACYEK